MACLFAKCDCHLIVMFASISGHMTPAVLWFIILSSSTNQETRAAKVQAASAELGCNEAESS